MKLPDERHEREQYFFQPETSAAIAGVLAAFAAPCVLCAPLVGAELARRKAAATVLDIDTRFAHLPGFCRWDIHRPTLLDCTFDVLFCDPPFFTVSLSQLFAAIRMLARHDLSKPLAIGYLSRRRAAITATFAPFGLMPTGFRPQYLTVRNEGRNEIEVFANFDCPLWTQELTPANIGDCS